MFIIGGLIVGIEIYKFVENFYNKNFYCFYLRIMKIYLLVDFIIGFVVVMVIGRLGCCGSEWVIGFIVDIFKIIRLF